MDMVKLLVQNGANLQQVLKDKGIGVAHFAASNGDVLLLDYILSKEPEVGQL